MTSGRGHKDEHIQEYDEALRPEGSGDHGQRGAQCSLARAVSRAPELDRAKAVGPGEGNMVEGGPPFAGVGAAVDASAEDKSGFGSLLLDFRVPGDRGDPLARCIGPTARACPARVRSVSSWRGDRRAQTGAEGWF